MATPVFVVGYDKAVSVEMGGNVAFVTLNITAYSWEESVNTLLVTHSGTGGLAARIAGVFDGEGTVEANYDSANIVTGATILIKAGVRGQIKIFVGTATPFIIPVIIQKVPYKSSVDGLVQFTFSVQLDAQSGSYVYPA